MCGVYIYLLQKDSSTVAVSFECLIFCETLEDIMILHLSECLSGKVSATNIYEQNMFPMCDFVYATQQSSRQLGTK